jgi:hypothetical protein
MAQAGYTPIQLYYSTTAAAVPLAANLAQGELAINIADGKLYYENSSGVVTLLASSTTVTNSFSAGTTGFTPSTATTGAVTLAGTLITSNGGTGLSSYTAGDLSYYASGTALTKLAIGTAGQILTSSGTAPQWSTLSGVAVTTFSAGTTGFTPSSATSGAVTLAGTLATTNGGTGLGGATPFTSGGVVYASSSSALATGSALTFDGTNLGVGTTSPAERLDVSVNSANGGGMRISNPSQSNQFLTIAMCGSTGYSVAGWDNSAVIEANAASVGSGTRALYLGAYNGPVIFATGSSTRNERARISATGDFGIGTTNPAAKLDVQVSGLAQLLIGYQTGGTSYNYYGANNHIFRLGNDSELMRLNSTGLGIGTSSPATKLDVNGSISIASSGNLTWGGAYGAGIATIATPTAGSLGFYPNGSTSGLSMVLNSSGNLGLGVTPSAWNSAYKAFEGAYGSVAFRTNAVETEYANNTYRAASADYLYKADGYAQRYYQNDIGQHTWLTAPNNTSGAGATAAFTQAMTLDASGNLGIGTTSPGQKLSVVAGSGLSAYVEVQSTGFTSTLFGQNNAGDAYVYNGYAGNIRLFTGATERARIDSSGNLLVGSTSTAGSVGNTRTVLGGLFRSFAGSASAATDTFVTLFAASAGTISSYLVTVWVSADDVGNYQANVIVNTQGGSSTKVTTIVAGSLLAFQMSGYNFQAKQTSGGTATIEYSAIRIAL